MTRRANGSGLNASGLKTWAFIGAAAVLIALAAARFPDFFIVTFALFGFAVFCGAAAMLWALWRFFGERWEG